VCHNAVDVVVAGRLSTALTVSFGCSMLPLVNSTAERDNMDTSRTFELVVVFPHKSKSTPQSVNYPLSGTQVALLQRAAEQGMSCVPDNIRDELQAALDSLSRVGMVSL
jgi:hypothetical protein